MDFSSLNFLLGLKYLKWEKQDSFYWEDKEGFFKGLMNCLCFYFVMFSEVHL